MAGPVAKPYPRIIMTSASSMDPAAASCCGLPSEQYRQQPVRQPDRQQMGSRPIGVFDSGVGGLTVARSIIDQLPNESILYVGDTAHGPYGPLPIAEVRANALGVMDELVDSGVKLLTIACNSASAAVLRDARERYTARYGIPVIEVIQPAVRRAVAATRTGRVGVIGTSATVGSRAYEDTFAAAPDLHITSAACPAFVPYVEAGITTGPELLAVAREYLEPLKAAGVDTVVLGCTHYPLLTGVISYVMGEDVTLVSSAEETGQGRLPRPGLPRAGTHRRLGSRPQLHRHGGRRTVRAPRPALPRPRGPQRPPRGPRRGPVPHGQPGQDHAGNDRRRAGRRGPSPDLQLRGAVFPAAPRAPPCGGTACEADHRGLYRILPGPGLAGVVLPADRQRRRAELEDRPGPRQRGARRHPALHGPRGH